MVDDHAVPAFADQRRQRYAAARGLQADKPGAGGRHADRAAAIRGMRHRHDAGSDQCRRTARRAAAGVAGVPGIAGDAEGFGFGHQPQPVFRRRRGDDRNEPGGEIALGQHRIDIGQPCRNAAAAMRRHALDGDAEVLDGEGHAGQRQRAVDGLRPRPRGLVERLGGGIDVGAGGLGAGDRRFGQVRSARPRPCAPDRRGRLRLVPTVSVQPTCAFPLTAGKLAQRRFPWQSTRQTTGDRRRRGNFRCARLFPSLQIHRNRLIWLA